MKLATGGKGKSFNDRELAGEVRGLALKQLKRVLEGIDKQFEQGAETELTKFQADLLLKLSPTLLPRLNEVTGADGEPLIVKFDNSFNATPQETKGSSN